MKPITPFFKPFKDPDVFLRSEVRCLSHDDPVRWEDFEGALLWPPSTLCGLKVLGIFGDLMAKSTGNHGMIMVWSWYDHALLWFDVCVYMFLTIYESYQWYIWISVSDASDSSFHPWRLGTLECRRCSPPGGCCHQKSRNFDPSRNLLKPWQKSRFKTVPAMVCHDVDHGINCRVCHDCNLLSENPWILAQHLTSPQWKTRRWYGQCSRKMGPESKKGAPWTSKGDGQKAKSHGSFTHRGFTIP